MITGNLEYLMTSLPNLSFSNSESSQHMVKSLFSKYASDAVAPDDLVSILNLEAQKYLSSQEFERFQKVQLKTMHYSEFQESSLTIISEFSVFMYCLKDELKTFRKQRNSKESTVKTNFQLLGVLPNNPLKAEEYLLEKQWQKLNDLSIGHFADLSALILYKLKLAVLLRWWQFNTEVGFKVFQESLKVA